MTGKVHSIESFGTLDGPGIRTVVFLQGCPNRCKFCHNPDSMLMRGGTAYTVEELTTEVLKNRQYWENYDNSEKVKGGVTFSGGEPLMQAEFLAETVRALKKEGVNIVIDTSANASFDEITSIVQDVDLWMISVKQMFDAIHKDLVGVSNEGILENIIALDKYLSDYNKKNNTQKQIRIRFVIIPNITDTPEHLDALGVFIQKIQNLEKVELLPYTTLGRSKWIELFGEYNLEGVPEATAKDVTKTKQILSKYVTKF